eukprot:gene43628-58103_t
MPDLLSAPFLICAAVACIAGMVRGFAGFGAAMLMTPIFSALYGPAVGIALCLLLEIAVALPLVPRVLPLVDWRRIGLLLLAAVLKLGGGDALVRFFPHGVAADEAARASSRHAVNFIVVPALVSLAAWAVVGAAASGAAAAGWLESPTITLLVVAQA